MEPKRCTTAKAMTMSKWHLFGLLAQRGTPTLQAQLTDGSVTEGIVQSVLREDGSGKSFIVKLNTGFRWQGGETKTEYLDVLVNTTD